MKFVRFIGTDGEDFRINVDAIVAVADHRGRTIVYTSGNIGNTGFNMHVEGSLDDVLAVIGAASYLGDRSEDAVDLHARIGD